MAAKAKKSKDRKQNFDQEGIDLFAAKFKEVRKRAGYTQQQLAFESGINLSQIARIETGQTNPTVTTIFTLARTMNIDPDEFFKFKLQ